MSASDRPKPPSPEQRDLPDVLDPADPTSEEELRAAETLRRALEGERANDRIAELAQAVRAVASPETLSPERHRQILDGALSGVAPPKDANHIVVMRRSPSKARYYAIGGAASVLALAAAVALWIRGASPGATTASNATAERGGPRFAVSRSTVGLFPEGIPRSGGTTDRVDRIAYARAQDFRQNQFARWGAR
jgi:hypothetical protein